MEAGISIHPFFGDMIDVAFFSWHFCLFFLI